MKNRLFWRMFFAFLGTLLATVIALSMLMVVMVREERRTALEAEVRVQARDAAQLMRQSDLTFPWQSDAALSSTLSWKLNEIRDTYGCEIWLVTGSRRVWVLGDRDYSKDQLSDTKVVEQLYKVLSGEEIRVQGLIDALGQNVVTIGVPWQDMFGRVAGAVLLHLSTDSLSVDYSDMIRNACIAGILSLILGAVLAYIISKRQTDPLRQINGAVTDFAAGHLDRRVTVKGNDELAQLADSFNRMAEDLSNLEESRKSFVASVSHELRSPLTCIRGYVSGMLDGTIPEAERARYLTVVLSEAERLTKLVNELLDLSRFESGKFPLALTRFDINELLRVELLKFEGRIEEKNLSVEVNLRDGPAFVLADADRIRQVVTNLLDNAVKFAGKGGQIELTTRAVDQTIYVSVKNDGPPIAQEDLPFIFERFYKGDKAHTSGMGTGLGLSIAKVILDQHGQKIRAASGAGGTTFTFTLKRDEN